MTPDGRHEIEDDAGEPILDAGAVYIDRKTQVSLIEMRPDELR
jgi:hypothetical protein